MTDEVKLYNVNDGVHGRTGGPFLDQEQDRAEEVRRAKVEGREPDFDTSLTSAGTALVSEEHLVQRHQNSYHSPSEPVFDSEVTAPVLATAPVPTEVSEEVSEEVVDTSEDDNSEGGNDDNDLGLPL